MKREQMVKAGDAGAVPGSDAKWKERHPRLWEFLVDSRWDDGKPRDVGSVTLFCEGGTWRACLNDKACNRVAFVSADDPPACLGSLEKGLAGGTLDWRPSRRGK